MATLNPFDLLGDDDSEDPSLLIAAAAAAAANQQKVEPKKNLASGGKQPLIQNKASAATATPQAKLPTKPIPPTQAVRDARSEYTRGGRGGGGRGYTRGGRGAGGGSYRDSQTNENSYGNVDAPVKQGAVDGADTENPSERRVGFGGSPRGPYRGGRRGGFSNGELGDGDRDRTRRPFDRRSGTGRGSEIKREGSGRGNWGTQNDDLVQVTEEVVNEEEKPVNDEKPQVDTETPAVGEKEEATKEVEEKEPEVKEMTLEEYEKLLEEKRKTLVALKTEERKVDTKEFESMQQLSNKKSNEDIFIKLGSDKDKKKELAEKEEKAKKSVSINDFLKPVDGEKYYNPGGRGGRGRGRGTRGGYTGGSSGGFSNNNKELAIEDPGQFPILGGK